MPATPALPLAHTLAHTTQLNNTQARATWILTTMKMRRCSWAAVNLRWVRTRGAVWSCKTNGLPLGLRLQAAAN